MRYKLIGLLLGVLSSLISTCSAWFGDIKNDPYQGYEAEEVMNKSPIDLLKLRGFDAEVHYATTRDGYKLNVIRVLNPALSANHKFKRPIIFNHGLFESPTIWLINSRNMKPRDYSLNTSASAFRHRNEESAFDKNLNGPMMMSNAGHDVWLMSMRGTEFSRGHENLRPEINSKFWDYSLDDFSLVDVPTVVDYVIKVTGSNKVAYAGHSQATFTIFALLSKMPHYADRIEPVFAVAPVAYFHNIKSLLKVLVTSEALKNSQDMHGPVPLNATKVREAEGKGCGLSVGNAACRYAYSLGVGVGRGWPRGYFTHLPFTTSLKVFRHFGQLILSRQFQQYDYGAGSTANLVHYGQAQAPVYRVEDITSKSLCFFTSPDDTLSTPEDIELFVKRLRVPLLKSIVIDSDFNHLDLITHPDAGKRVFSPMLDIIDSFELS